MGQALTAERVERRAMIAVIAVFVLLVQALFPTFARAGVGGHDGRMICTEQGLQPAPVDGGAPLKATHDCDHCVCAPAAMPAAVAPTVVSFVRYAERMAVAAPPLAVSPGRGLAAPPPPATGPPSIL